MPWLESVFQRVIRRRVETLDFELFESLGADDILFIDSSHVIHPQSDVLFECLEILPRLAPGVIVHFHDVFSLRDYLREWVLDEVRLWNEQYLLEAFLTCNADWKVIGALNYLRHHHYDRLHAACPFRDECAARILEQRPRIALDSAQRARASRSDTLTARIWTPF
jgi:hypothetical protein